MGDDSPDARMAWNRWNSTHREASVSQISDGQAAVVEHWLRYVGGAERILEVGCGTGWMAERLTQFGSVTATDLADEVVERAQRRYPEVRFVSGDFLTLEFETGRYDAVVTLETLSHVADQRGFLRKIHGLLNDGGLLIIATQNRPVMEKNHKYLPNHGWYRKWVDRTELTELLHGTFEVRELRSITPVYFSGALHAVNSRRVEQMASRVGLGRILRRVKQWEEDHDMGWTLMCLATKIGDSA